ncbi:MAG TPA: transporter substrate-binding domain-containing protein [Negativicutes bacterium]|jgi:putative nucleotidyltransferase with HDIG domain
MAKMAAVFVILVVLASGLGSVSAAAITYEAVGDKSYPPFVYVNDQKQQDGYDVAVLRLLERKSGINITIRLMEWEQAKTQVQTGNADILIGIAKTLERSQYFDFTEPYMETKLVIFTHENNFTIHSSVDLIDRRIGVQGGDLSEDFLKSTYPQLFLYRYPNQLAALRALETGEVDAVVGNYYTGMYNLKRYSLSDKIKVIGTPLLINSYCLGVRKGNKQLLEILNEAIHDAKEEGEIKTLQNQWFGENYFVSKWINSEKFRMAAVIFLLTGIVVVGIGLSFIYSLRHKVIQATAQLSEANRQLTEAYDVTIRAFFKMLEHRESGTAEHSMAVNEIALAIGSQMRLSSEDMLYLNWGTLLHDIGKLAISNEILLKKQRLLPNEYAIIQQHAQVGYEILNNTTYLRKVGEVARYHHERYDGHGYPSGLQGEEIPLLARICAVADSFEAIIADRPYQHGRHYQEALTEIINNSGSQFDPQVVAAFICLEHSRFAKE